jgi:hypothetical protein
MPSCLRLLPLALLALTACPPPPDNPDAGTEPLADVCNDLNEALTSASCELKLGEPLQGYISVPGDQDWYSVRLPATVGPRTLVRVQAGYAVPSTAVNLAVNVLQEDGQRSLGRKVDNHGAGAPRPVEFIIPFTEPGARLVLLLSDEPAVPSRPNTDVRSPYSVQVTVLENPDPNEPNDTTPTALPLTGQGGGVQGGSITGYIATAGDVDRYTFNVPANQVGWVKVSAPAFSPPPPFRLSYELIAPDGTRVAEDQAPNNVVAADLSTARRLRQTGTWQIAVRAYRRATDPLPPEGDLRQQYTVEARVMPEEDASELSSTNDTLPNARVQALPNNPGNASVSFTGRLAVVPDPDWYAVDVPASSQHTVLRYRLVMLSSGGRFPPLSGIVDRQIRVVTEVTGASVTEARQACLSQLSACPRGFDPRDTQLRDLVNGYCNSTPPQCLRAGRDEAQEFTNLRNFGGTMPVPPHATTLRYYFLVQDSGNNWADDRDYRLEVQWLQDVDEDSRFSSGTEQPTVRTLAEDSSGTTYPAPPRGAAYEASGVLSYGHGRSVGETREPTVRGPNDYDAVPTDVDRYTFQLPSGLTAPLDRTWALQWEVQRLSDGGTPADLALELTFCDGDRLDGGTCTPVRTTSQGNPLVLAYRDDNLASWQTPPNTFTGLQPLYERTQSASATTVTLRPYACTCLEPRFIRGGTLDVAVSAVDRTDHVPVQYTLRTAYTDYPQSYGTDGGTATCPPPQLDAGTWLPGCRFTRQP